MQHGLLVFYSVYSSGLFVVTGDGYMKGKPLFWATERTAHELG